MRPSPIFAQPKNNPPPMPCDVRKFDEIEFFSHLSDDDRAALAEVVDAIEVSTGKTLFVAGEPGDSLFVMRKGEIEIFIKDTAGQKIVLNVVREGDIFGELALLDTGARTATALALEDSELLELDRDDLLILFRQNPEAA